MYASFNYSFERKTMHRYCDVANTNWGGAHSLSEGGHWTGLEERIKNLEGKEDFIICLISK